MLGDDEALAVLLGLVAGRPSGVLTASGTASETPRPRSAGCSRNAHPRLDALLAQVAFTGPARNGGTGRRGPACAGRRRPDCRPVRMRYVAGGGRRSERMVQPYGLVAHAGRWYMSGLDVGRGEERTFRMDRIADPRALPGAFRPPSDYDPAERVLSGLARTPY